MDNYDLDTKEELNTYKEIQDKTIDTLGEIIEVTKHSNKLLCFKLVVINIIQFIIIILLICK